MRSQHDSNTALLRMFIIKKISFLLDYPHVSFDQVSLKFN